MIFTARQLEQMHRSGGKVVLPYRARLTPLAQDWIRQHKVEIGYTDVQVTSDPQVSQVVVKKPVKWMWWADGPCGPAKAALLSVANENNLNAVEIGVDPTRMVEAIKIIAREIKSSTAEGGVMLVSNGAAAMIYANRCPSLRAVLGTCIEAVEQGVKIVAANLLIIEHPYKSLQQTKALTTKFVKGQRVLNDEVKKQLSELSSCA